MAEKVRIRACGIDFLIETEDDEDYMREIAEKLEKDMTETSQSCPTLSTTMSAVLTALGYCDELTKAKDEIRNLKKQLKNAVDDASAARFDSNEARREIERLSKVIKEIRNKN